MTRYGKRVVVHEANQVAVVREYGCKFYYGLIRERRGGLEGWRHLKQPQHSLTQAKLYRARVLTRAARRRRFERNLRGRWWDLRRRVREAGR